MITQSESVLIEHLLYAMWSDREVLCLISRQPCQLDAIIIHFLQVGN